MRRYLALMTVVFLGAVLVVRLWAQPLGKNTSKTFQGYWMGVDPLDGGDSRRSLVQQPNGTFAMAGRDSYLTLCDNTDRGLITFDDGVVVGRRSDEDRQPKDYLFQHGRRCAVESEVRVDRRQRDDRSGDRSGRNSSGYDHLSQSEPRIVTKKFVGWVEALLRRYPLNSHTNGLTAKI